jgi:glutamyl endopeptidase
MNNLFRGPGVLAVLLLAGGTLARAQGIEALADPHLGVSSDGQMLPMTEDSKQELSLEGFEGYGPAFPLAKRFEETGAAVDRAEPVLDKATDFLELLGLPGLGQGDFKSIIGTDSRGQVTATTTYPWRSIALVTFDGGRCTGWFFGANTVVTAGHCVHSGGSSGAWKTNVRVYPGRNGSSSPYGFCRATRLFSVLGWTSSKNEEYDYGAVKLDCTIGNSTGWPGIWWQSASLTGLQVTLAGYPGDKALTLWRSTGSIASTQTRQIFYLHDSVGGQSGAPVFQNRVPGSSFCTGQCVTGIHTYGLHGGLPHKTHNHATRLTQEVVNNLSNWRNQP